MDIYTVSQYIHRTKKIAITNKNLSSSYNMVLLKITLDKEDIKDNETVRFSYQENSEWLEHQQFDNDFYCYIPNQVNQVYYIYAHFFPSSIYEYNDNEQIFSIYNFEELYEALGNGGKPNTTLQTTVQHQTHYFDGQKYQEQSDGSFMLVDQMYDITADIKNYSTELDEDGNLIIKAFNNKSVTKDYDPNYKNFLTDTVVNNTQKGMFPLSSKYRSHQEWNVPDLNEREAKWSANDNGPHWEVSISRIGLSPLIVNKYYTNDNRDIPLNVYLNYEYLPSSREYHQHYFGFHPDPSKIQDYASEQCKLIGALEGTNLNMLDNKFGSINNYRLINNGNPYSDKKSFYVDYNNSIPINLEEFIPDKTSGTDTCTWKYNECDYYWILNPTKTNVKGSCHYTLTHLKEGTQYTLKYYTYIPSKVQITDDITCYVAVQTNEKKYMVNKKFLEHDKMTRDQWIYHETTFRAGKTNKITIVGPYKSDLDTIEGETLNSIFFINMSLEEMVQHTPTLKYTNNNVILTVGDQSVRKSLSDTSECVTINPDNKRWIAEENQLPTPYSDIQPSIDNNKYVEYDKDRSTYIYYHHPKYSSISIKDDNSLEEILYENNVIIPTVVNKTKQYTEDHYYQKINDEMVEIYSDLDSADYVEHWETGNSVSQLTLTDADENIQVEYNYDSTLLIQEYKNFLKGVRGKGNRFVFHFRDTNGEYIKRGNVEIGIFETTNVTDESTPRLRYTKTNTTGKIIWDNVDLSLNVLPRNTDDINPESTVTDKDYDRYYVRIKFEDNCTGITKTVFKTLYVSEEIIYFSNKCGENKIDDICLINAPGDYTTNQGVRRGHTITLDQPNQFPLRISSYIRNNNDAGNCLNEGWCELSIDEEVHQSTLVDQSGRIDFYLNPSDVKIGGQTIKIEYFRKYNIPLAFIYFTLNIAAIYDKDSVLVECAQYVSDNNNDPTLLQTITDNSVVTFTGTDDIILLNLTPDPVMTDYCCEVIINDEQYFKENFYSESLPNEDIPLVLEGNTKYNIVVKTGNIIVDNQIYEDKYDDYEFSFQVKVQ
ncbi:MAG: hypothetical protein IKF82_00050 [Bacilli bacterium]|nr:hypothetical protein [Bacilli bacterium]